LILYGVILISPITMKLLSCMVTVCNWAIGDSVICKPKITDG